MFEAAFIAEAHSEPIATVNTTAQVMRRDGSGLCAEPKAHTAPEMMPRRGGRRVKGRERRRKGDMKRVFSCQLSVVSCQLSVPGSQLSALSSQLSALSSQLSALSSQLSAL